MSLKKNNFISFKKKNSVKTKPKKFKNTQATLLILKLLISEENEKNYSNENTSTSLSVLHLYIAFNA